MKKILQLDGGGLKGVIPAVILENFEKKVGRPCCEVFDLITGTSTGAIIGGVLASGVSSAEVVRKMYVDQGSKLFTPRIPIPFVGSLLLGSQYDRKPFIDAIQKYTGNKKMNELKTQFMATAFNLCSGRTHFIYSTDPYEKGYPVWEVISWSALSAAAYFGKINVSDFLWDDILPDGTITEDVAGAVFQDGGQGINNCTLGAATVAAIAQKWFDEKVLILSLGCGDFHEAIPYGRSSKTGMMGQVVDYLSQARNEAMISQYQAARCLSIKRSANYVLIRVNCRISKQLDVLDGVKFIQEYVNIGNQLKDVIPFDEFTKT